jgi:hypothetical protein
MLWCIWDLGHNTLVQRLLRYIFHLPVLSMSIIISPPSLSHLTPWLLKCVFKTFESLLYH